MNNKRSDFSNEIAATLKLALPLIAGQVSQMALGLADTFMLGRVGVVELATCALAHSVLHLPFMLGIGLMTAVSVRVSQARGSGNPRLAGTAVRHGMIIGLVFGIFLSCMVPMVLPLFRFLGQDPMVVERLPTFFLLITLSLIPGLMSIALKNHSDGLNRPWLPFWVLLGGVVLNILLNWIFIFGKMGSPELGLEGAGLATLLARVVSLGVLFALIIRPSSALAEWLPNRWLKMPRIPAIRDLLKIGAPTSLHLVSESGAFAAATLMVGAFGAVSLAAHQVAITCVATVFMIPLGLGLALTIRVGDAWGARQFNRLRLIVFSGWVVVAVVAIFSAAGFIFFKEDLAHAFLMDPETIALTQSLFLVAAFFQLADAFQVTSACALRGMNDVKIPALLALAIFWLIALPIGALLAFKADLGAIGAWIGITTGLTLAGLMLSLRLWKRTSQDYVPQS